MSKYNWNPEEYHISSSEQFKWAKELIAKLSIKGNEKILDVGCGDGKVTAEISKLLPEGFIVGVDNSLSMIKFAKENFPEEKFPNLIFICADARNLSFEYEFDIIFSNATLHWIKDHLPVLQGFKNILKNSGRILLQMGGKGNAQDLINVLDEIIKEEKWKSYFENFTFPYGFFDINDYEKFLNKAGLLPKRIELLPKDMIHKGEEKFKLWIKTTWLPYTQQIPESKREMFIDEVVKSYIKKFPIDNNGLIHLKMMRLEVEAIK
ncbi:methyltransferase domain-containing protein [Rosettibacter firmus]|uniref:methyltransferase domain-containing protein n=1 Tax=Rosettibacter firmus TaxID=3111522 RepID=UPI00336C08FF